MEIDIEKSGLKEDHNPAIFISRIEFKDGFSIQLSRNSIIVFTGANNCGKSQVLREIEMFFQESPADKYITSKLSIDTVGSVDDTFITSRLQHADDGNYWLGSGGNTMKNWITEWNIQHWSRIYKLFINRLDTEGRLTDSKTIRFSDTTLHAPSSPLKSVYDSNELEDTISSLFHEAFGESLIVNRRAGGNISLHVGEKPLWEGQREGEGKYYDSLKALPRLDLQGDGMRSFASILLDTFTSEYSITLIDEPEAFLHPPQARILGKMLARPSNRERQLFIATHSTDFIHGLLDVDNDNVIVIQINRVSNTNNLNALGADKIKELWKKPLLRYSNILNGLFHEKVIICESEYDCLFYRAILDAIYESDGKTAPDIMFTQCGGKDRISYAVAALNALNVPVVAITDFDIIDNCPKLKELVASFGLTWDRLSDNMNKIYACINADGGKIRSLIKKNGSSILYDDAPAAFFDVDNELRTAGLFIVPVGEIECFDKTIRKDKKDWVYAALDRGNLGSDNKLEAARRFVQAIVDFKPQLNLATRA